MEIALIGLNGSGKTMLFNALTGGSGDADTTGGARGRLRVGVAKVPDPRLDALAKIFSPHKVTPAEVTYWDIPPPLEDTGRQTAIGGQFLNQLQGADGIIHVVRAFEAPTVPHPQGSVDPLRDVATMHSELVFSDLVILEGRAQRIETNMKGATGHERDQLLREQGLLEKVQKALEGEEMVHRQSFSPEEARFLANYQLLTSKPLLVAYNVGEERLASQQETEALIVQTHKQHSLGAVALCAKLEGELAQLSSEEEAEFRKSLGAEDSGVHLLIQGSLDLLGMITFFTFVSQEVRAWTVPRETPALQAAGRIHSDMERGFIRAEVTSFDDMVASGTIAEARKRGLLRSEGKNYQVQDGDVITFLFNV